MRILIIEDEWKVAQAIRTGLEKEGYEVVVAADGSDGYARAASGRFDLIVLDLMLPRKSGTELLTELRQRGVQTAVLILTAKDAVDDKVHGLDAGADDYLVKPFAFSELLARLRALSRRGRPELPGTIWLADLVVETAARTVRRADAPINLTPREFDLLIYLLRHQGYVVSRDMLARDVWNEPSRVTPLDNVIDVHMAHLRKKIDDPFGSKLIHTVRGVGFLMGKKT